MDQMRGTSRLPCSSYRLALSCDACAILLQALLLALAVAAKRIYCQFSMEHMLCGTSQISLYQPGISDLQDVFGDTLLYEGVPYPGTQALTLQQLEQFVAKVRANHA